MPLLSILLFSLLELLNVSNDIQLVFVGDAMQHKPQVDNARTSHGHYDYTNNFTWIKTDIASADYAVVNLECPLAGPPYTGYPCFGAPDDFAKALKNTGFDFFLTANNHCLDRRDAGLKRTISTLDAIGVPHSGTFINAQERELRSPSIIEIKGVKFAILNYTYGTNGIEVQKDVVVNYINRDRIAKDIALARNKGAKIVAVCVHWGIEYKLLPNDSQKSLADFLVSEGVDLIIGSHPHVVQPMEIRHDAKTGKDIFLVYSLGNFISNMSDENCRGGAMAKINMVKTSDSTAVLKDASYKLFFVQKPGGGVNHYGIIPSDRIDLVKPSSKKAFDQFMRNTRDLFTKYNVNVPESK